MAKVLIVGQGLAGSTLSILLRRKNIAFKVVDQNWKSASSLVAAGMWNPIVYKRITLSWKVPTAINKLFEFFESVDNEFSEKCFHPTPLLKLTSDPNYENTWDSESAFEPKKNYLGKISQQKQLLEFQQDKSARWAEVKKAGYVNLPLFLKQEKERLLAENRLIEEKFDYQNLLISKNYCQYKNEESSHVIFAEGWQMHKNPYFNYLPLNHTQGDVLTFDSNLPNQYLLNFGKFLLPLENGRFKMGSTYHWNKNDEQINDQSRAELIEKFSDTFNAHIKVIKHQAGVRPTVKDRRPLCGQHPEHKTLFCFNGLGTKGVMVAPYLAENFLEHIFANTSLDQEADINRYTQLWKK